MYLKQKCPKCGTEAEFVYVQIGHAHHCKHCNSEFLLVKQRFKIVPMAITIGVLVLSAGVGFFLIKRFHDWWIYR